MSAATASARAVVLEIEPVAPFDFLKALTVLETTPNATHGLELGETTLSVGLWMGDPDLGDARGGDEPGAVAATVRSVGNPDAPRLEVRLDGAPHPPTPRERRRIEQQLEGLLGLSDDLEPFFELARDDPDYWRVVEPIAGVHRLGPPTPFEAIVWTILKQRQFPNVARARLRNVRQALGGAALPAAGAGGERLYAFPSARTVAAAPLARLGPLVKKRRKTRYVRSAAEAFADREETDPGFVTAAPPDEVRDWLESIRGVGPWSARTFLSRAIARPELELLLRDGRLEGYDRAVLERCYGPGVELARLRELAERYGPYEELWLWYARTAHRMREVALGSA